MSATKNAKNAMPEVEVKLGDKLRKLCFDFNAICRLEEKSGKNALSSETWNNLSALDVRALLWAACLKDDPELTIESVGEFITFKNLPEITAAIEKAFAGAAVPEGADSGNE